MILLILNSGEVFNFDNITFELIKKIRQKMVQFKVSSDDGDFSEKVVEKWDGTTQFLAY